MKIAQIYLNTRVYIIGSVPEDKLELIDILECRTPVYFLWDLLEAASGDALIQEMQELIKLLRDMNTAIQDVQRDLIVPGEPTNRCPHVHFYGYADSTVEPKGPNGSTVWESYRELQKSDIPDWIRVQQPFVISDLDVDCRPLFQNAQLAEATTVISLAGNKPDDDLSVVKLLFPDGRLPGCKQQGHAPCFLPVRSTARIIELACAFLRCLHRRGDTQSGFVTDPVGAYLW